MFDVDFAHAAMPGAAGGPVHAGGDPAGFPPQPNTVGETGLERQLIVELIAKVLFFSSKTDLAILTTTLHLSIGVLREALDYMVAEQIAEVAWRGASDIDVQYRLTSLGKRRAEDFLAHCRYIGPAPVTLADYRAMATRHYSQPLLARRCSAEALAAATLEPAVRGLVGAAMHSGRALLLHGPSGSGKSTLARQLGSLRAGVIPIPHAILIEGKIVRVYDRLLHLAPLIPRTRRQDERRGADARWAICRRPLVQVGAELSRDMLDLQHDPESGVYHAPPHLKANGGVFVVDDLGCQELPAHSLLTRFLGPLDRGVDQLAVNRGHQVGVPFDLTLVFVTNLAPHVQLQEALLRRIGYSIHLGALGEEQYRSLFRQQCHAAGVHCDEAVLEHLVARLHPRAGIALLACYPREVLARIADFARFADTAPRLTLASLEQAWTSMFIGGAPGAADVFGAAAGASLSEKI